MSQLIRGIPVLPAFRVAETVQFYVQKLGFSALFQDEEYGIIERDAVEIHFWKCEEKVIAENTSCRLIVEDVEAFYALAQREGIVHPRAGLEEKPWGGRELGILDVNGNLVWFVENEPGR